MIRGRHGLCASTSDSTPCAAGRANLKYAERGFTLIELVVSMAASIMVLAALIMSGMALHRGLNGTRTYAEAYSDQRRVTDYIGRDLRRAVGIAMTDESGTRTDVTNKSFTVTIEDRATFVVQLPGYYRSDVKSDAGYMDAMDVVAEQQRLDYGTKDGLAKPVEVAFRKIRSSKTGRVSFIRQEADQEEVLVNDAENMHVQVTVSPGAQTSVLKVWHRSTNMGPKPLVTTHDRLLLRNPPLEFKP